MNFKESLNYLYGLGYELSVKKFGLENTLTLLKALKNPEQSYLKVQVAGTNGKGSTCAFLESICVEAKIPVGKFTSPHLISVTERIRVDGHEISEKEFAKYATRVRAACEKLVATGELAALPTFFEQVTAIALCVFAKRGVDLAILETGLGGRFDATTATRAEIVAITPIDYDHQNILGDTLAEISAEKAAVIRADTKVIISEQNTEALEILVNRCQRVGVKPIFADYRTEPTAVDKTNGRLAAVFFGKETYGEVWLGLRGRHQLSNARTAIQIAEVLTVDFDLKISKQDFEKGLENAEHRGRLEFCGDVLFDGAHNTAGARALGKYLDEFIEGPITLVFGAMREKDLSEIAAILFPKAATLILARPENPRALETAELFKFVPTDFDAEKVLLAESVEDALTLARENARNGIILVTGSLYLVGEIQGVLKKIC